MDTVIRERRIARDPWGDRVGGFGSVWAVKTTPAFRVGSAGPAPSRPAPR